ncbi:MAG: hypothetical protein IIU76_00570 [Bacteroidales bacterium]|nr:hypothetical protein [Bacteroidales bacterium]
MSGIRKFFNKIFSKSEEEILRDKIMGESIDFGNVVSSSLLAKGLYDELKTICHPDRFHTEVDIQKANELFQLINQNKGDYNRLLQLKEQVYNQLPIQK